MCKFRTILLSNSLHDYFPIYPECVLCTIFTVSRGLASISGARLNRPNPNAADE